MAGVEHMQIAGQGLNPEPVNGSYGAEKRARSNWLFVLEWSDQPFIGDDLELAADQRKNGLERGAKQIAAPHSDMGAVRLP